MPVVDASVVVAFFAPGDVNATAAERWISWSVTNRVPLAVPSIILSEVAAALSRAHGGASFARQMLSTFMGINTLTIHPVSMHLASSAADIAANQRIRGCDAIYVALAAELGVELVTFDRQQLERAREVVTVLQPE